MHDTRDIKRRLPGRPAVLSRSAIENHAVQLFHEHGFAETTIEMISAASGVSRTSFFRYYSSKSEIIWSAFDEHTARLRRRFESSHADLRPVMDVVRHHVVDNLRDSVDVEGLWTRRFQILDSSPELRSEVSAHWISWGAAVAEYVAQSTGRDVGDVLPQSIGGAVQGAFLTVLRRWLTHANPTIDLMSELDDDLMPLCRVMQSWIDE